MEPARPDIHRNHLPAFRGSGRHQRILLPLLLLRLSLSAFSQDTTTIYQDIQRYTNRHRFTRWVHGTIFVQADHDAEAPAPGTPPRRVDPLMPYTGRIVRSVEVEVLDPFGFDLIDSTARTSVWLEKVGNKLHRTTRHFLVRNFVLVKKNEAFDPLEAAESERLLRASPMVNDVRIIVVPVHGGTDTVDVRVVVMDSWNIEVWANISGISGWTTLQDRNLLGLGQELRVSSTTTPERILERLDARHAVYNISGTYISSALTYGKDELTDRVGLQFNRPFFSPLTRWAGAVLLARSWNMLPVLDAQGALLRSDKVNPLDIDTWLGRSFPLMRAKTVPARSSAVVAGFRYGHTRYTHRPATDNNGLIGHPSSDRYLLSVGLSVRQYYRDRYLYRFGAMEDVPEGLLAKLTGGFRDREGEPLLGYTGVEFSRGRHHEHFGYLTTQLAFGTFWEKGISVDATARMELRYFSDLFRLGRWYLRQFVTFSAAHIVRKQSTERLDLNGDQLFGFRSILVAGTHRQLLKFETVAYAPYRLLGFRFAPVLLAGFGTIGGSGDPLFSGRIHTSLGMGILIRNESLLVKTFEFSISFYPYVPEENGSVLDVGRFNNFTIRPGDFAFTQPGVVGY